MIFFVFKSCRISFSSFIALYCSHMFPLPKLTEDLSRVLCYRMITKDAKSFCPDFQMKRNEIMWNWLFSQDALTLNNVWIFDIGNMDSLAMWAHFNLNFMKKILKTSMVSNKYAFKRTILVQLIATKYKPIDYNLLIIIKRK